MQSTSIQRLADATVELVGLADVRPRVRIDVVLVTATKVELTAVLRRLSPISGQRHVLKLHDKNTYFVGQLGAHTVALVMSSMGTTGKNAATLVTYDALQLWLPKAVIMPGIAFGRHKKTQLAGDVLVAEQIIPYGPRRLGRRIVHRGAAASATLELFDRFRNAIGWVFDGPQGPCSIREGALLSGDELVDNPKRKRQLFNAFPAAIGGEMEGAGVSSAAQRMNTAWILAKAVCDWADGKKNKKYQRVAAEASVSLVEHVLSDPTALAGLEYTRPARYSTAIDETGVERANTVLPTRLENVPTSLGSSVATASTDIGDTKVDRTTSEPTIVPERVLRTLRLLARSPLPLDLASFAALFPNEDWKALRKLPQLLKGDDESGVRVSARIKRQLFDDPKLGTEFDREWVRRLEALRQHPDTAILLTVMYLRIDRREDAIATLAASSQGLEPGYWSDRYRDLLQPTVAQEIIERMPPELAAEVLNAFGLCQSRSGEYQQSIETFARLESLASRANLLLYEAYASINRGVACFHLRHFEQGRRFYERTIALAERLRDEELKGRALNNLGLMLLETNPTEGLAQLHRSLRIKLRRGDVIGAAGTMLGEGNYYARRGDYPQAFASYRRVLEIAVRNEHLSLSVQALINMATALTNAGDPRRAFKLYVDATRIAENEGYTDLIRLSTLGEAVGRLRAGDFPKAETLFERTAELARTVEERLKADHDRAVAVWKQGRITDAEALLDECRTKARRAGLDDAELSALVTNSKIVAEGAGGNRDARRAYLLGQATSLRKSRRYALAARVFEIVADLDYQSGTSIEAAERTLRLAEDTLARAGVADADVRTLKIRYVWRRERGQIEEAFRLGEIIERRLASGNHERERAELLDEQGVRLQQLGRFDAAERMHRAALTIARNIAPSAVEAPLNNLGLLLQRTGRPSEAIPFFEEAVECAANRYDLEAEGQSALNMVLALLDLKRTKAAKTLLETWRDRGERLGLSSVYVRALHTLANMAARAGDDTSAARQYQRALREAELRNVSDTALEIAENYTQLLARRFETELKKRGKAKALKTYAAAYAIADKYGCEASRQSLNLTFGLHVLVQQRGRLADEDLHALVRLLADSSSETRSKLAAAIAMRVFVAFRASQTWARSLRGLVKWIAKHFALAIRPALAWPFESGYKLVAESARKTLEPNAFDSEALATLLEREFASEMGTHA